MMRKLTATVLVAAFALLISSCKKNPLAEDISAAEVNNQNYGKTTIDNGVPQHTLALQSAADVLQGALNGSPTFFGTQAIGVSSAMATLAVDVANNPSSPYRTLLYDAVKKTMNDPANQFVVTGNDNHREGYGAYFAVALAWKYANANDFSAAEEEKIMLTMKAALVAGAYVMTDYTFDGNLRQNERLDMRGNVLYTSPNYAEGYAGSFLAAMTVIGKNNVYTFLKNYDHSDFISSLNTAGLTRIADIFSATFNKTVTSGQITTVYDASTDAKKETLIKNYVRYIDDNETDGLPFFKTVTLTSIVTDPIYLTSKLNTECFNKIAREGDYINSPGMATEFNTVDNGGSVRDALYYSASGVVNDLYSRFLVEKYGYWLSSTQTIKKDSIDQNLKVGFSDIISKAWNGYITYKIGSYEPYNSLVPYTTGLSWWQRVHDIAHTMGVAKEYYLNDSFEDSNYTAYPVWTASGTWSFASVTSFTGYQPQNTAPEPVIKTSATVVSSRLISAYSGTNYDVTVQCKINSYGTGNIPLIGLIGRYVDANNYYLLRYNQDNKRCEVTRFQAGATTVLAYLEIPELTTNTLYILRASFNGNQIKFYINGSLKVQATDSQFTAGKIGLFARYTDVSYDDVFVNKPTLN
ncbi:hypothetical protein ACFQ3S_12000 [Mucilaginibacter terrae]|uniref:hypothetical protein n=1 Tax=Mucilaginibacter terrae TaxID=1955052 RepID=UPI003640B402